MGIILSFGILEILNDVKTFDLSAQVPMAFVVSQRNYDENVKRIGRFLSKRLNC